MDRLCFTREMSSCLCLASSSPAASAPSSDSVDRSLLFLSFPLYLSSLMPPLFFPSLLCFMQAIHSSHAQPFASMSLLAKAG